MAPNATRHTQTDEVAHVFTVSEISRALKELVGDSFPSIVVEGEISNFTRAASGHLYFSLKDAKATLSCAMWRSSASALKFQPEPGMKVQAFGGLDVYPPRGSYQLIVRRLRPLGAGDLEIAFRQLYDRLEKEGVFSEERKCEIPGYPFTVGVVTSPTGAAIRDIVNVFQRRNPLIKLILYPAQVQGEGAEEQIAVGLDYFNAREDIDVIIVGRGGGSLEDLWSFNTETVVRAIERSEVPVVSGVGHEVDWTLADYTADYRAPTPSAAAEIVSWELEPTRQRVSELSVELAEALEELVMTSRVELESVIKRGVFANPYEIVTSRAQLLDMRRHQFVRAAQSSYLALRNPLTLGVQRLDSLSPLKTLSRGYAVARASKSSNLPKDAVVRRAGDLQVSDEVEIIVSDGSFNASVLSVAGGAGRANPGNSRE